MERGSLSRPFYVHGYLCASHPVEVLLLCITGTVCLLTLNIYDATHASEGSVVSSPADKIALPTNIHVHISATSYFLALLCLYLQCKKLIHGGISVLLGVVGIFLVFSFTVYTSVVGNIFGGEFAVLREALPFFCLLSDFVTVGDLAKFALSASSYEEAYSKIAQGVATLGPSVTLNTLVGALVIGVGSLSGVGGLETASYFGCLALLSHYIMFMTFLPACLSLFLEMCFRGQSQPSWLIEPSSNLMVVEQEHISNPLLQHVKVIMSAGLMFVHAHSWLMVRPTATLEAQNHTQANDKLSRFLAVNAEEVLAFVLAVLVAARYMYLEKDKADNLLEVKECKEKTAATQIETTTSNGKDSITITDNAESRGSSVASISTSEKSFKVKDQKEKTATRQMYTTTKCKGKDLINASTDSAENRKGVISSTGTSKITKDFYTNAQVLLRKSQTPRKRSATFCLGDSSSLDEDLSDQNRERSDIDIESIVEKKRSFSLLFNKAPKKSHSSHDIFKNPAKESESTTLHSGKELKVPKVKVTRHESLKDQQGQHSPPLKSLIEGKTSYESCTRSIHECKQIMKEPDGIFKLNDNEICCLVEEKVIPFYQLETALNDYTRAVSIRRKVTARKMNKSQECLKDLPHKHYDYTLVSGACCENVIGYMPIPVGVAGPLLLDGRLFYIPMATTEGCLVASTNRGCRALSVSGGVRSSILGDGMTRGPVVRFPSAMQASEAKLWLEDEYNFDVIKQAFDGTSRFARLKSIKCAVAGRLLFARFAATTGDAMGMNMLSKGTENALKELQLQFPCMEIISLSGNYCTDKKATAMNWIEGRGKSVVCEAIIPGHVVMKVLKTSITALTELNTSKNLVGSAMAGAIGGFNAHAANIVTALFIATGQDPAQNMESSNCITLLEPCGPNHEDLYISCTMPSLEVGTVGGGTILPAQASCLEMLGVKGACSKEPGQNASQLARIICGTVLAGELSLLSALAAGQLVQSHLKHNRSTINLISNDEATKNCAVL